MTTVSLGRFDRSLDRVTLLIALLGFCSLVVTGETGVDTIVLATIGLTLGAVRHRLAWTQRERNWTVPSLAALALCVVHWQVLTRDALPSIILFTTYLLCLRVVAGHSLRDRLQVFAIAFGMLLLASVLTTSFLFLPICLVMGVAMLAGLVLVTIRRSAQATLGAGGDPESLRRNLNSFMSNQFYRGLTGVSIALYLIAVIFFYGLPRYQGNDWFQSLRMGGRSQGGDEGEVESGAGESVGLDEITQIRLDHTIAMRVSFVDNDGERLATPPVEYARLRGLVLRQFDGNRWHPQGGGVGLILGPNMRSNLDLSSGLTADLQQVVYQESNTSPYFYGINRPVELALLGSRARNVIINDRDGWARLTDVDRTTEAFSYQIVSSPIGADPQRPTLEFARNIGFEPIDWNVERTAADVAALMTEGYFTSMPIPSPWTSLEGWESHGDELGRIAYQWASEGNARDPIEVANLFAARFRQDFRYSLESQVVDRDFPIMGFLTQTHEGHCEYFATAMVLMLRTLGTPARLVTGYLSQEWNDAGQFFVVRESHAHAWVEVYTPDGRGWLTWDPTPPEGLPAERTSGRWMALTHWLDAQRHHWYTWVIDLSQARQIQIFRRFGIPLVEWRRAAFQRAMQFRRQMDRWDKQGFLSKIGWSMIGLSLAGAIMLVIVLVGSRLRIHRVHGHNHRNAAPDFYRRLIRWLKRRGYERPTGRTPAEFARSLIDIDPGLKTIGPITDLYYRQRFGTSLSAEERTQAERLVDELTG